jgi:hypothetical protein
MIMLQNKPPIGVFSKYGRLRLDKETEHGRSATIADSAISRKERY